MKFFINEKSPKMTNKPKLDTNLYRKFKLNKIEYELDYEEKEEDNLEKGMLSAFRFCFMIFAWFMSYMFYLMGISEINKIIPFYLLISIMVFIGWFIVADKQTKLDVLKAFGISLLGGLLWVPYYGFYYPIIFLNQYWTSLPDQ